MTCAINTLAVRQLGLMTYRPVKLGHIPKGEVFFGPPSPHCVGTTADIRQIVTPDTPTRQTAI